MAIESKKSFPQPYGKYELLERIGEGGMAEVFRARLPGTAGFEKILVVKRILPHLAKKPEFVSMFVDEAKLAAKIQHQNVVQVFELGEAEGGELYMAMEYVPGVDFRRLLVNARDRKLRIPIWFSLHVLTEVLDGLAYAHDLVDSDGKALQVVHRDVTPGNIFVSWQGEVKLADFGIAKAVGRVSETEAGQVKGNAPFMSPEAIYGRTLDARADVFSAGVVLWASLALRLPFEGASNYETAKKVCEAKREPPSRYNPAVPKELDALSLSALEIDRDRRIASAREFQSRLVEILSKLKPKLLPSDVRHVMEVLSGRKPPDAQFNEPPAQPLVSETQSVDVVIEQPVWSQNNSPPKVEAPPPPPPPPPPPVRLEMSQHAAMHGDEAALVAALSPPTPPVQPWTSPVIARQVVPAQIPQQVASYRDFGESLYNLPDEPLDLHDQAPLLPAGYVRQGYGGMPQPQPGMPPVPQAMSPGQLGHPQAHLNAQSNAYGGAMPPAPPPQQPQQQVMRGDLPLATMMDFMAEQAEPLLLDTPPAEKFFPDAFTFYIRFKDGQVLTAKGLDEFLHLAGSQTKHPVAVAVDKDAWVDIPTFARLCGLDYLLADNTPLRKVKMVGLIEEQNLVSVFHHLSKHRLTGKLVIMDKGVNKVARREIDVVQGAPVHVFADQTKLQFPYLYVQHDLVKKELMPELVVQAVRQRQPLEEVARRQTFTDLNPYRPVLMRDRLAEVFTWRYGRFAFDIGRDVKGPQPFAASLLRVLPDAVQRGYEAAELRQVLEPYMNVKLKRSEAFDALLQDLGLKDKHAQAARRLGQRATLGQLVKKNASEEHVQLVMAHILIQLDALSVG